MRLIISLLGVISSISLASADGVEELCTDRPTKSNAACVVDAGSFQVESDAFNWTHSSSGDVMIFTNPTIKYGFGGGVDLEANITPLEEVKPKAGKTFEGAGDLYLRVKDVLYKEESLNITILPYIKIPTAPVGIGNKVYETGIILPVSYTLPRGWTVLFDPELDTLKNTGDNGHHIIFNY